MRSTGTFPTITRRVRSLAGRRAGSVGVSCGEPDPAPVGPPLGQVQVVALSGGPPGGALRPGDRSEETTDLSKTGAEGAAQLKAELQKLLRGAQARMPDGMISRE